MGTAVSIVQGVLRQFPECLSEHRLAACRGRHTRPPTPQAPPDITGGSLRWRKRAAWGQGPLAADEWAVLRAEIIAQDLIAVDDAVEELTGFMDPFRADIGEVPLVGVTDGQLSVVKREIRAEQGRRGLELSFYAAGGAEGGGAAFARLNSAASAFLDHLNAEGISVDSIRWTEGEHIKRPF